MYMYRTWICMMHSEGEKDEPSRLKVDWQPGAPVLDENRFNVWVRVQLYSFIIYYSCAWV